MGIVAHFVADTLGLSKLPPYLPTFFYSFLSFTILHLVIAPVLSRRWFPTAFGSKNKAARNNWSIHVVSQVHAVIIVPISLWCIFTESSEQLRDPAFGWDDRVGYVYAIATGYFLWDTLDAIYNFIDIGFVIHGLACFLIFTMTFRPFVAYLGIRCLVWETSTFFLNIHWFLDKTGRTGSKFQLINGFLLLSSFFGVRMVYGGVISYKFLRLLRDMRHELPLLYMIVYGGGNIVLQALNWFWFIKMIAALKKRFNPTPETKSLIHPHETEANGTHSA